ncbi:hypothetical protein HMPREF9130_1213 [Peptoniphilus sp. oral taxon 375 str. F0436]|nr:hypothetical protein HMPREF9130_1213 [Peptoniphilus sp. oral taxon 375 str. F0436]
MAGKDNFQLAVEALAKMVQDGTIVPILKPKMRVIVNGPATVLYVGEEKTVVKVHDENFDLEKGIAMAILKHCGFKRSTMRKLMENAEIQDMEGIINGYYCKN